MRKHLFGLVLTLLVAVSALLGTVTAEAAGNFVQVADTGVLELKSNQKWEKEYRTKMGDVKIRFRNLANSKENKRYHLIIWWRDPGTQEHVRVCLQSIPRQQDRSRVLCHGCPWAPGAVWI